jgi:hypothetical protein
VVISCVGTLRSTIENPDFDQLIWTSIASIVAAASVAATHSGDPKDPEVPSRTVKQAAPRRVGPAW